MSKPLSYKDDGRKPHSGGSSKARSGSFPTKKQMERKKKKEAGQRAIDAIWRQGTGGS